MNLQSAFDPSLLITPTTRRMILRECARDPQLWTAGVETCVTESSTYAETIKAAIDFSREPAYQAVLVDLGTYGTSAVSTFAIGAAFSGPAIPIVASGALLATGVQVVIDKARDEVGNQSFAEFRFELVNWMRDKTSEQIMELAHSNDPRRYVSTVFSDRLNALVDPEQFPDLNPAELAALNEQRIAQLYRYVELRFRDLDFDALMTESRSDAAPASTGQEANRRAAQLTRAVQRWGEQLKGINRDVERLSRTVEQQQQQSAVLTKHLYENMPPEQQMRALREGLLDSALTTTQRKVRQAELEIAIRKAQTVQTLRDTVKAAQDVNSIIRNVGLPVGPDFDVALNVGAALAQTALAFATQDVLGGIASWSSAIAILAGPKKSPEAFMAEQIRVVLGAIKQLSQQMAENHRKQMDKLNRIHADIMYNRQVIVDGLLRTDLARCEHFLADREAYGYDGNAFPTLRTTEQHLRDNLDSYRDARRALQDVLTTRDFVHPIFLLQTYERPQEPGTAPPAGSAAPQDESNSRARFRSHIFDPVVQLLRLICAEHSLDTQAVLVAMAFPCTTIGELRMKHARIGRFAFRTDRDLLPLPWIKLVGDLLEPTTVDLVGYYTRELLPYYEWISNPATGELHTAEALLQQSPRPVQFRLLRRCLQLAQVALIQQSLISGDLLVAIVAPRIGDILRRPAEDSLRQALLAVLGSNRLFTTNLAMWHIRALMRRAKGNPYTYAFLMSLGNPSVAAELLGEPLQWSKYDTQTLGAGDVGVQGLLVGFKGAAAVSAPSVTDVASGSLAVTEQMAPLKQTYAALVNIWRSYEACLPENRDKPFTQTLHRLASFSL